MKLSQIDRYFLSQCAISAACQAGYLIRQHVRAMSSKQVGYQLKQGQGSIASRIVTKVDLLAQEALLNVLSESSKHYDLALLTEELPDDKSRLDKDYFWCIDPLDGTLYFSESISGYSVSIALVSKNGESILGVIYDPHNEKLYVSHQYQAQTPSTQPKDELILICDRHFLQHTQYDEITEKLSKIFAKQGFHSIKVLPKGGAVINAMSVLEYTSACYFKLPKQEKGGGCLWDYAASASFFNTGTAIVTDMKGDKLNLNSSASVYMNHCGVVFASNEIIANCIYELYQEINQ